MHGTTDNKAFNEDFNSYRGIAKEEKSDDSTVMYFLYVNRFGQYFIERREETAKGDYSTYVHGDSGHTTAWTARESLDYEEYPDVFIIL